MSDKVYIGQLNQRVEIWHIDPTNKSLTGETTKTPVLIGPIQSLRKDGGANETQEDKIFYLQNRTYTIRFVEIVFKKGEEMFVRDEDGDYQIYGIELIGKKEFLKLKTNKRE